MVALADVIEYLVAVQPGRTARQIAVAIYGERYPADEIEVICRQLVKSGRLLGRQTANPHGSDIFYPASITQRTRQNTGLSPAAAPSLLSLFQAMRADLRLSHARLFIEVAVQEGLSIGEYARRLTLPEATARQHCLDMSSRSRNISPQPVLLQIDGDPEQSWATRCKLTLEGCRFLARLWDSTAPA